MKNLLWTIGFIACFSTVVSHALMQPYSDKELADQAKECREHGFELRFERDFIGRYVHTWCHSNSATTLNETEAIEVLF